MKKRVLTVVIVVLALAVAGVGGFILFKNINSQGSKDNYKKIAASYVSQTTATQGTTQAKKLEKNPVDFAALHKRNPEIYGWIKVPGTEVDYPVLQSESNDNFYIDHDVDKNYAFAGAIYSQMCNRRDFADRVTVLYGHNMADNSMFASLHSFEDPSFFNKHKDMTIYTDGARLDYEVVSAYVYDDTHIMNSFNFSDDKVYREFLDGVMHPRSVSANVRDGASLGKDDKIVILSTCLNAGDGRYLVVGKLKNRVELEKSVENQ